MNSEDKDGMDLVHPAMSTSGVPVGVHSGDSGVSAPRVEGSALGADVAALLMDLSECKSLLEVARKAIEDTLIEWRDNRLSELGRRNGLVIRETDGTESSVIRFGPETAVRVGLRAIATALENGAAKAADSPRASGADTRCIHCEPCPARVAAR